MVHEKSFRKESLGKFNSKAAKNSVIRGRVINHSVLISSISRLLSMEDEEKTRNKNKAEKNSQDARFANLSEDQLQQILTEKHSLGTTKVTNWSLITLKVKFKSVGHRSFPSIFVFFCTYAL